MLRIYVVFGACGEYSDRQEWPVVAFFDEELAKMRVENATRRSKEIDVTHPRYEYEGPDPVNEFDVNMSRDYTGTTYYYVAVEIADATKEQADA